MVIGVKLAKIFAAAALVFLSSEAGARETIFQVALLQSLAQGHFGGAISVGELRSRGDIGIGTFDSLDGEMIVLDGVVYQARGDGSVVVAPDSLTVPFSNVTHFDVDAKVSLKDVRDIDELASLMSRVVSSMGRNSFCMARVDGTFGALLVRSERAQSRPFPTLVEALAEDQTEFDLGTARGTLVALYCPSYVSGLNTPGWHFHFISEDRTRGGHVLAVEVAEASAAFDITPNFEMMIPSADSFHELDLARDMKKEIESAEKDRKIKK